MPASAPKPAELRPLLLGLLLFGPALGFGAGNLLARLGGNFSFAGALALLGPVLALIVWPFFGIMMCKRFPNWRALLLTWLFLPLQIGIFSFIADGTCSVNQFSH